MPKIEAFFLGGEAITDQSRKLLKTTFDARVFVGYASTECGIIAAEEKRSNLYKVYSWNNVVELLDDDNKPVEQGNTGSVVITNLINKATPIIRYSGLGDLARFFPHTNEKGMLIEAIEGRVAHSIVRSNGEKISPFVFTTILQQIPSIMQYQINQRTINEFEILLVLSKTKTASGIVPFSQNCQDRKTIVSKFTNILGNDVNIDFKIVNKIPTKDGTHKTPLVSSLCTN